MYPKLEREEARKQTLSTVCSSRWAGGMLLCC